MSAIDFEELKKELLNGLQLDGRDYAAADDFLDEIRLMARRLGRGKAMQLFAKAGLIITKITSEETLG